MTSYTKNIPQSIGRSMAILFSNEKRTTTEFTEFNQQQRHQTGIHHRNEEVMGYNQADRQITKQQFTVNHRVQLLMETRSRPDNLPTGCILSDGSSQNVHYMIEKDLIAQLLLAIHDLERYSCWSHSNPQTNLS
jgi:hypothetical protein